MSRVPCAETSRGRLRRCANKKQRSAPHVMVGEGPPSTTVLRCPRQRRGWRAFARHDALDVRRSLFHSGRVGRAGRWQLAMTGGTLSDAVMPGQTLSLSVHRGQIASFASAHCPRLRHYGEGRYPRDCRVASFAACFRSSRGFQHSQNDGVGADRAVTWGSYSATDPKAGCGRRAAVCARSPPRSAGLAQW
jgi:hypothetical protein